MPLPTNCLDCEHVSVLGLRHSIQCKLLVGWRRLLWVTLFDKDRCPRRIKPPDWCPLRRGEEGSDADGSIDPSDSR